MFDELKKIESFDYACEQFQIGASHFFIQKVHVLRLRIWATHNIQYYNNWDNVSFIIRVRVISVKKLRVKVFP